MSAKSLSSRSLLCLAGSRQYYFSKFFRQVGGRGVADSLGNSMGERIYKLFFTTDTQTNASNSEGKFAIAVISYQSKGATIIYR